MVFINPTRLNAEDRSDAQIRRVSGSLIGGAGGDSRVVGDGSTGGGAYADGAGCQGTGGCCSTAGDGIAVVGATQPWRPTAGAGSGGRADWLPECWSQGTAVVLPALAAALQSSAFLSKGPERVPGLSYATVLVPPKTSPQPLIAHTPRSTMHRQSA
jgi:hypothetical protein